MHRLLTITAAIACCATFGAAASAASCDDRFPGSCRTEVSTTVIEGVPAAAKAEPRKSRQSARQARAEKRKARAEARKARAESRKARSARRVASSKRSKPAARQEAERVAAIPMPQPRPADDNYDLEATTEAASPEVSRLPHYDITGTVGRATPHLVVDETFNLLLAHEPGDTMLESALLSRRDQMVGSAPREPRD